MSNKQNSRSAVFGDDLMIEMKTLFAADNRDTLDALKDAITKGDKKTAHRIAHSLKSGAGTIERYSLQDAAYEVELALDAEKGDVSEDLLDKLETEFYNVMNELAQFLNADAQQTKRDKQTDIPRESFLSDELETLLRQGNPRSLEYVESMLLIPEYAELARQIDDYDFDDALDTFTRLKNQKEQE